MIDITYPDDGRYWGSADVCHVVRYPDGASLRLFWADGSRIYEWHDSFEEAEENARRLGFAPCHRGAVAAILPT